MTPYLEQQILGDMLTAEHKVLIETCESGNNQWNLALICDVDHGFIEKSTSTPHRSKRYGIAE